MKHFDLAIIGAGAGGLTVAAVAANLGHKVVLFEGGEMGGDCLNHGCVPSKALLAAARQGKAFAEAMARARDTVTALAPHDSQERFEGLGVTVVRHYAHFTGPRTLEAGGKAYTARRFVIATGSSPFVPPLPGLEGVPFLTNETLFKLTEHPRHLLILGGGPIGCEMAQAFSNMGSVVTLIEAQGRLMPNDDPELTTLLAGNLNRRGIFLKLNARAVAVAATAEGVCLEVEESGKKYQITGSHLLIAAGRRANLSDPGLEEAGIRHNGRAIEVNHQLRTSNPAVYAVGDVVGPYSFTHMAAHQAGVVIGRLLFGNIFSRVNYQAVAWCTFTSPELAQAGLTEEQAQQKFGEKLRVVRVPMAESDRATAEGNTEGLLKVMVGPRGRVAGVSIFAPHAGELLAPWALMVAHRMPMRKLSSTIFPYPTWSDIHKKALSAYYKDALYAPRTGKISRLLFRWLG